MLCHQRVQRILSYGLGLSFLVAMASCSLLFSEGKQGLEADAGSLAKADAKAQENDALACLSESIHVDTCAIPDNLADLDLDMEGTYVLDTEAKTLIDPGGNAMERLELSDSNWDGEELVILRVLNFNIRQGTRLHGIGGKPLAIFSRGEMEIAGTLDVSSVNRPGCGGPLRKGAGADSTQCQMVLKGMERRHGGGGGGFGSIGGAGGLGKVMNSTTTGIGGGKVLPTSVIQGGCPGGDGGYAKDNAGKGGHGGGAIQLTALGNLKVSTTGKLLAGGSGGQCGYKEPGSGNGQSQNGGGGGGGGSGGLIDLESQSEIFLETGAVLVANGAGAGRGATFTFNNNDGGRFYANSGGCGHDAGASKNVASGAQRLNNGGNDGGSGGGGGSGAALNKEARALPLPDCLPLARTG